MIALTWLLSAAISLTSLFWRWGDLQPWAGALPGQPGAILHHRLSNCPSVWCSLSTGRSTRQPISVGGTAGGTPWSPCPRLPRWGWGTERRDSPLPPSGTCAPASCLLPAATAASVALAEQDNWDVPWGSSVNLAVTGQKWGVISQSKSTTLAEEKYRAVPAYGRRKSGGIFRSGVYCLSYWWSIQENVDIPLFWAFVLRFSCSESKEYAKAALRQKRSLLNHTVIGKTVNLW